MHRVGGLSAIAHLTERREPHELTVPGGRGAKRPTLCFGRLEVDDSARAAVMPDEAVGAGCSPEANPTELGLELALHGIGARFTEPEAPLVKSVARGRLVALDPSIEQRRSRTVRPRSLVAAEADIAFGLEPREGIDDGLATGACGARDVADALVHEIGGGEQREEHLIARRSEGLRSP